MNGAEAERWSAVAELWASSWAGIAAPANRALLDALEVAPGEHALDIGCGSGELLRLLDEAGAGLAGVDPAAGMLAAAARIAPDADLRAGGFGRIPWPDRSFDIVVSVNALQFAPDMGDALREMAALLRPGGRIGIANWAETSRNDIELLEAAADPSEADGPDPDYRCEGGLERLFEAAGLRVSASGLVSSLWTVPDDDALVSTVLMGSAAAPEGRAAVLDAARAFATPEGYTLRSAFRFAVGAPR